MRPPFAWDPASWRCLSTPLRSHDATRVGRGRADRDGRHGRGPGAAVCTLQGSCAVTRCDAALGGSTAPLLGPMRLCPSLSEAGEPCQRCPACSRARQADVLAAACRALGEAAAQGLTGLGCCFCAGHGRALLEAIEDICRALNIPRILLCSTGKGRCMATACCAGACLVGRGRPGQHAPVQRKLT